jgi:hypothetical protein
VVVIDLAGEPSGASAVESILRERLAQSGLDVRFASIEAVDPAAVVTPVGAQDDELARIWIDLRAPERITLYLVDGKRERVLVRHFARHDNPEVAREELGHVVELALVALRAGERIGIGREAARAELVPAAAAPPPVPPPPFVPAERPQPAPPAPRATTNLSAGAFYEAEAYAAGPELWSGPGLVGELRRKRPGAKLGYGALLSAQYRLPSRAEAAAASSMRFEGGAVHALAVGSLALSRPAELSLGLGGGLDLVHAEARGGGLSEVRFADGSLRALPNLRALARWEYAVPSLRVFLGVGVDVPLQSARYLLARPGESVVLFEAWSARPFLLGGIETP